MLITNVEQTKEESNKEPVPKPDDVKNQKTERKVAPSSATVGQVTQQEQTDRTKVERTRTTSAPEVALEDSSQDRLTDSKAKNVSVEGGEDTTDGGEQRRRRSSQKDGRGGSLKVRPYKLHMYTCSYTVPSFTSLPLRGLLG